MAQAFELTLNGELLSIAGYPANMTLLQYLRATGRTGTKEGCAEGDCGACTVVLVDVDAAGKRVFRAINSCITLLPMVAGRELFTVEGVGQPGALHPVQVSMVERYGSQCGFCTPGFICSMFETYYRDGVDNARIGDALNGNLCRCTGYRPIRDAMTDALAKKPASPDLFQLRLDRDTPALSPVSYESAGQRFDRPTTLTELLTLLEAHPDAVLVAGATELGVEVTKKARRFAHLISTEGVAELRSIERRDDAYVIGGAVTLTMLEEALGDEMPAVRKMLWAFASRQIRNRATLAGNLVTASPIGDMAPLLLALGASVVLSSRAGERTVSLDEFFVGYRKTVLAKGEIMRAIVLPRARPTASHRVLVDSYKVSKRRELDISIVAAAYHVEVDEGDVVRAARLGYGGVAATPSRARKTEAFLLGKRWDAATMREASALLEAEFSPIDDVRSGKGFRRGLVASLFEKLFSGEKSLSQDAPITFAPGSCSDVHDPSRALAHESAVGHVTGTAHYVDDQASRRPMLELWPVCSPHAHARIVRRDAARARAMPGVVTVLLAEDIPGDNDVGAVRKDETLLAQTEACFHGHMVAVVVADTIDHARAAAAAVEVDYEPMPAIIGLDAAITAHSFHNEPHVIRRGDVDAALASAPRTLEGELELGGQEHFYLESHAAWAERGDDGDVMVVSSTQHPSEVQAVVSHVLHLPRHRVVVQSPRMGGGFGGKETQGNTFASLVALAAYKTGRPARISLDRDLDMTLTGKRHPFHAGFRVGFDDEGRLLAAKVALVSDGGWAIDLSEAICDRALFHLDNSYYIPAVEMTGRVAKTNVVSHTAFRGFGGPQGMVVIEDIMARVAAAVGRSPEEVRQKNLYRGKGETATTHYGQHIDDCRAEPIWRRLRESSRFDERRAEIARFNEGAGRIKRGIAITPVKFGISFTATLLNQAGALVLIYRDGTVQVNHGGTEMGQGLYTKIQGIVMRELGITAEAVRVMKTQTDKVPNTSATAASSGADLNGAAVANAVVTLRERVTPIAAELLSQRIGGPVAPASVRFEGGFAMAPTSAERVPFAQIAELAYVRQISLSATGYYRTPGIAYDRKKGFGRPFHYFAYGAAVSEVEVDGWSGMKRVLRVDIVHDVGDSLNPGVDRGQIEGAFVQGAGWLTGEELKWTPDGRLLTHSASTYQIPAIGDAPADMRVELYPHATQPGVIHGSKAVGEPPFMLAISVREALRDAIGAFGGTGGFVELPSPATHEAIYACVRQRLSR